jgi:predicted Zn-dependent peptidase
MLSLESPAARMGRLAGFILHDDDYRPLDEMLAEIDRITLEAVAAVAQEFFAPERQTVVRLGPQNGKR